MIRMAVQLTQVSLQNYILFNLISIIFLVNNNVGRLVKHFSQTAKTGWLCFRILVAPFLTHIINTASMILKKPK